MMNTVQGYEDITVSLVLFFVRESSQSAQECDPVQCAGGIAGTVVSVCSSVLVLGRSSTSRSFQWGLPRSYMKT